MAWRSLREFCFSPRDRREDGLVEVERPAEHFRDDFPGDVVAGRTEPARHEDDVASGKGLGQHRANLGPIGDRGLPLDAESELEQLLAKVSGMGVDDLAEEQFGSCVDDFEAHGSKGTDTSRIPRWNSSGLGGCRRSREKIERQTRRVGPEVFKPVDLAQFRVEDVDDDIDVIEHDPEARGIPLGGTRLFPDRLLRLVANIAGHGFEVGYRSGGADHEIIRQVRDATEVQHEEILGVDLVGELGAGLGDGEGVGHDRDGQIGRGARCP
jgi:hypothetical protein